MGFPSLLIKLCSYRPALPPVRTTLPAIGMTLPSARQTDESVNYRDGSIIFELFAHLQRVKKVTFVCFLFTVVYVAKLC
jgi:hypothetical protein